MNAILFVFCSIFVHGTLSDPSYFYGIENPYVKVFGYSLPQYGSYANRIPSYPYNRVDDLHTSSDGFPVLNVLAEVPYSISNTFTVVPMVVVSKESMKMVTTGEIMTVSKKKPEMTLKTGYNDILRCTPAVKIVLDTPIVVYSLKSNVMFPSLIEIVHESYKIPIRVGTVIAPVTQDVFVSYDTPITLSVVYAIPSDPVKVDYVNNDGVVISGDGDSVIVESPFAHLPPKNITVIDFPDTEAEPVLEVDEEDADLVNRNPPIVLAPAGIVQSTQPQTNVQPFYNSKESSVLTELREQSKKRI